MKKRDYIFVCLGLVVLLVGVISWLVPKDPSLYNGKSLSDHLDRISYDGWRLGVYNRGLDEGAPIEPGFSGLIISSETRAAIEELGPRNLPMLKRRFTLRRTLLGNIWKAIILKLPIPESSKDKRKIPLDRKSAQALAAFKVLGTKASEALEVVIPRLTDPEKAFDSVLAIKFIQPEKEEHILSLTNITKLSHGGKWDNPNITIGAAMLTLGSFGPRANKAIPFLKDQLSFTNDYVQGSAAVALARIGAPADEVVPLVMKTLPASDAYQRHSTVGFDPFSNSEGVYAMKIWAIEQYGKKARQALPLLTKIEKTESPNVQQAARRAIDQIERAE